MMDIELTWQDGTQACANPGVDPEWFFADDDKQQLWATKICRGCPLMMDCAKYALHHNVDGVWGGMTERQLRATRRQLNIRPKPITGDSAYGGLGIASVAAR